MTSPVDNAASAARQSQKLLAGVSVDITQSGSTIYGVCATMGQTLFESIDSNGVVIEYRARDFFVDRCDYDFGDGPVEPVRGAILTVELDGQAKRFEILPVEQTNWRRSDQQGAVLRIHTQELGT